MSFKTNLCSYSELSQSVSQGLAYAVVANIIKMSGLNMTKVYLLLMSQVPCRLAGHFAPASPPTLSSFLFLLRAQLTVNQCTCLKERRESSKAQMSLRRLTFHQLKQWSHMAKGGEASMLKCDIVLRQSNTRAPLAFLSC